MSKKANKTIIGGFVLGAIFLFFSSVLFLGGGGLFKEKITMVAFFDSAIRGLDIGAPVLLRGVKIGEVVDIKVTLGEKGLAIQTPVYIDIEPDRVSPSQADKEWFERIQKLPEGAMYDQFIQTGMRGQLQMQSLLTGKLFIALDFNPDRPAELKGLDKRYPELPTIPTQLEEAADSVSQLLDEIKELPIEELLISGTRMFNSIQKLAENIDREVPPLSKSLQKAVNSADKSLVTVDETINERSVLRQELISALENISEAARSIDNLADYLQRHPEALLQGKSSSGGK